MPPILLANHTNAPLKDLELHRIMLDRQEPHAMVLMWGELCLYALVGMAEVSISGIPGLSDYTYGIGGRTSILTPELDMLRVVSPRDKLVALRLTLKGDSADMLLARSMQGMDREPQLAIQGAHEAYIHAVGKGSIQRTVVEMPVPPGFSIHAGETTNTAGGWSSWPSHCAPQERVLWNRHEEVFWIATPTYGVMRRDGTYVTGETVDDIIMVHNNETIVTPLGDHEISAGPGSWLHYCWFYISFLKKKYNVFAHHVNTYIK